MDGRYRYRICIGKDEHGKPKYKNFYAATARDAKRAADAYRAAISSGMDPAQQKATLAILMYFLGVDVLTARDQMGPKDINVTLGIYTSLAKNSRKRRSTFWTDISVRKPAESVLFLRHFLRH